MLRRRGQALRGLPHSAGAATFAALSVPFSLPRRQPMFQKFESASDPSQAAGRIARLRQSLAAQRLDGFLVPRADEHQGEYVARRSERLQWLTGFTGSAGVALVMADRARDLRRRPLCPAGARAGRPVDLRRSKA